MCCYDDGTQYVEDAVHNKLLYPCVGMCIQSIFAVRVSSLCIVCVVWYVYSSRK